MLPLFLVVMEDLIAKARGDSVTHDRLTGAERYYPEASEIFTEPLRREGEIPQYIVLLTKGSAIGVGAPTYVDGEFGITVNTGNGSLILTNQALYAVTSKIGFVSSGVNGIMEFSYAEISKLGAYGLRDSGVIELTIDGIEYQFELAISGDADNVVEAYSYLREQVQ